MQGLKRIMIKTNSSDVFASTISHIISNAYAEFVAFLETMAANLDFAEMALIRKTAEDALFNNTQLKLNRVLLLELHAAKRAGALGHDDEADGFSRFIELTLQPEFAEHLDRRYPVLRERLQRSLRQQRQAIEKLVRRFIADRSMLDHLLGCPAGRLVDLALGQGDLHAGGQTVVRFSLEGGVVMYKPRSLRIDIALETFLGHIFGDAAERISSRGSRRLWMGWFCGPSLLRERA
jgi:lantibiotic modifying enzyme